MPDHRSAIVIIAGPTAAGKSAIALDLARKLGGEIVSADSVQIYRHMDVGSAKPSGEERARVPHHMIDIRDPDEDFSAGDYVREARLCISGIRQRGAVPLVVGGTGLYIRSLIGGIAELKSADSSVRQRLRAEEDCDGPGTLFRRLVRVDPETAKRTDPRNVSRIIRALEVIETTGKSLSQIQAEHSFKDRPYRHLFVCIAPDRALLYERIDNRVDTMIKDGLLEEVKQLLWRGYDPGLKALQSLGYRHMGMFLKGETDLAEAVRLMKRDTRRYAKRQFTWFRSEPEVLWFDPDRVEQIRLAAANFLGR